MNDQFQLWLIPPMLTAALSFWFRRKLTFPYSWPLLLQSLLIIVCAMLGLLVGPKPLWALITWTLFLAFLVVPNLYLRKCDAYYSSLNVDGLLSVANKIPIFYWGQLGSFWRDIYVSYAEFMRANDKEGDRLLARWKAEKLPEYFQEQLAATELAAAGLLWRWEVIIAEFYKCPAKSRSASLCLQSTRAFAETGQYELASQCIRATNLPNQRMSSRSLSLTYLQYFALLGAENYTRQVIDGLTKEKNPPLPFVLDVWWVRCLIVNDRKEEARELLQKLLVELQNAPAKGLDIRVWTPRLERQLALISSPETKVIGQAERDDINENVELVWQNYQDALAVQQVILPRRSSIAVNILLILIVAGYLFSGCIDLVDNPVVAALLGPNSSFLAYSANQGLYVIKQFYLEKDLVQAGQYYRLVSYLFLHGNLSHLLLNAVGLVWFGRIAAAIYGEVRFTVIYFVSGIVGGLAQVCFTDTSAVGASGAVFGIFASVVVAIFRLRDILPEQMRKRELRWMVIMTVAQVGLDRIIPRVAGMAHLGGIVAGLILGFLLLPKQAQASKKTVQSSDKKQE